MAELTDAARAWLTAHHHGVLVTLKKDGSAQTSNVSHTFDGGVFRVSVTADRAKTRNVARDPRVVLHVLGENFWSYASVSCTATLGEVSTEAGDAPGQDLLAVYEAISGKRHPNPDEFYAVQVAERRQVLTLAAQSVVGMGW